MQLKSHDSDHAGPTRVPEPGCTSWAALTGLLAVAKPGRLRTRWTCFTEQVSGLWWGFVVKHKQLDTWSKKDISANTHRNEMFVSLHALKKNKIKLLRILFQTVSARSSLTNFSFVNTSRCLSWLLCEVICSAALRGLSLRTEGEDDIVNSLCSPGAEDGSTGRNKTSSSLWVDIKEKTRQEREIEEKTGTEGSGEKLKFRF